MSELKTEIEKINQGCGNLFIDENGNDAPCKLLLVDRVEPEPHLCPSCRKYKQGLIQGAKMVIEDEIKFLIELSKFMTAGDEESIRRLEVNTNWCMVLERLKELQDTELKQLNNWLEKA